MLMNGAYAAGTVACVAQLGIPDLLASGPKSAAELATEIGVNPDRLTGLCAPLLASASSRKAQTENSPKRPCPPSSAKMPVPACAVTPP